jgi:hypothetical protein
MTNPVNHRFAYEFRDCHQSSEAFGVKMSRMTPIAIFFVQA